MGLFNRVQHQEVVAPEEAARGGTVSELVQSPGELDEHIKGLTQLAVDYLGRAHALNVSVDRLPDYVSYKGDRMSSRLTQPDNHDHEALAIRETFLDLRRRGGLQITQLTGDDEVAYTRWTDILDGHCHTVASVEKVVSLATRGPRELNAKKYREAVQNLYGLPVREEERRATADKIAEDFGRAVHSGQRPRAICYQALSEWAGPPADPIKRATTLLSSCLTDVGTRYLASDKRKLPPAQTITDLQEATMAIAVELDAARKSARDNGDPTISRLPRGFEDLNKTITYLLEEAEQVMTDPKVDRGIRRATIEVLNACGKQIVDDKQRPIGPEDVLDITEEITLVKNSSVSPLYRTTQPKLGDPTYIGGVGTSPQSTRFFTITQTPVEFIRAHAGSTSKAAAAAAGIGIVATSLVNPPHAAAAEKTYVAAAARTSNRGAVDPSAPLVINLGIATGGASTEAAKTTGLFTSANTGNGAGTLVSTLPLEVDLEHELRVKTVINPDQVSAAIGQAVLSPPTIDTASPTVTTTSPGIEVVSPEPVILTPVQEQQAQISAAEIAVINTTVGDRLNAISSVWGPRFENQFKDNTPVTTLLQGMSDGWDSGSVSGMTPDARQRMAYAIAVSRLPQSVDDSVTNSQIKQLVAALPGNNASDIKYLNMALDSLASDISQFTEFSQTDSNGQPYYTAAQISTITRLVAAAQIENMSDSELSDEIATQKSAADAAAAKDAQASAESSQVNNQPAPPLNQSEQQKKPSPDTSHIKGPETTGQLRAKTLELLNSQGPEWSNRAYVMGRLMNELSITPAQASGVIGNLMVESAGSVLDPTIKQRGGGPGRGVGQWGSYDDRLDRFGFNADANGNYKHSTLMWYAQTHNKQWDTIECQTDFIIWELQHTQSATMPHLKAAKTASDAADVFMNYYERPASRVLGVRGSNATKTYEGYMKMVTKAKDSLTPPKAPAVAQAQQNDIAAQKESGKFDQSQALPGAVRTPLAAQIEAAGQKNGELSSQYVVDVGPTWGNAKLNPAAAEQFRKLDDAYFAQFGKHLGFTGDISAYRTYSEQVAAKQDAINKGRPQFAATPGHSNHGLGLAADLTDMTPGSPEMDWMLTNAINFGWVHPAFANNPISPEPWHWEFNAGN